MNLSWKVPRIASVLALPLLLGVGCGGIGASGSVSPATFLLPGLGQADPAKSSTPEPSGEAASPQVAAISGKLAR